MSGTPVAPDDRTELVRLTQLLYQLPIGILRCGNDGRIELINGIVAGMFAHLLQGAAVHDGFELLDTCFPDLRALVREAGGRPGVLCLQRRVHVPPALPEHAPTWLSLTAVQLAADQFIVTLTDITDEVEHQEALRCVARRAASLADPHDEVLVCTLDGDGRIVGWSPAASLLSGWTQEQALGQHAGFLFDGALATPEGTRPGNPS